MLRIILYIQEMELVVLSWIASSSSNLFSPQISRIGLTYGALISRNDPLSLPNDSLKIGDSERA
jgi:hypothetical protein